MPKNLLLIGWVAGSLLLLFYSFTQIDLSLTLSSFSVWQSIQRSFQEIGYFQRPLSAVIYAAIIVILFCLYVATLYFAKKKRISRKLLFTIIGSLSVILFFSYNAFSYDLFNYIFDAKIFTFYFQNPYFHKALDFPEDPMLSFMHWTHRTYPYGPTWLLITIPFSFFGMNIFLATFYLFKLISVAAFVASAFLIERIAKKINIDPIYAVAFFCLNPLVIIETLVSAHHDIVMMAMALFSVALFLEGKIGRSFFWLVLSIGIKFATIFMLPAFLLKHMKRINNDGFFIALSLFMGIAVVLASFRTTFQPWYLMFILPFLSLVSNKKYIIIPVFLLSAAGLIYYIPYLYLGNWDPPVPDMLLLFLGGGVSLSFLSIFLIKLTKYK